MDSFPAVVKYKKSTRLFNTALICRTLSRRFKGGLILIQRMIEIGEGYSDLYELFEIAKSQKDRVKFLLKLTSEHKNVQTCSFAVILNPTSIGEFQPIYYCREGITLKENTITKREELFEELASTLNKEIITLQVRHSSSFHEKVLFHQYIIGILRLNHLIPPMK